jgi:hypothetical protein
MGLARGDGPLGDSARHRHFLCLAGLFRARPAGRLRADGEFGSAPQLQIELDELARGEPVTDARV